MKWFLPVMMIAGLHSFAAAAEDEAAGDRGVKVTIGSIIFTSEALKDDGADSNTYIGLEVFRRISEHLSVAGLIGYADVKGGEGPVWGVSTAAVTYIPLELNLKTRVPFGDRISLGFDAGISLNAAEEEERSCQPVIIGVDPVLTCITTASSRVLLGVQAGMSISFVSGRFFTGVDGKYQAIPDLTENALVPDYSNYRLGIHAGWLF